MSITINAEKKAAIEAAQGSDFQPLEPWRFWAIVELSGMGEETLRAAVDLIPDDTFKIVAKAKLANPPGGVFNRDDPLFSNSFLMMQLGKTAEEIDQLWQQALAL